MDFCLIFQKLSETKKKKIINKRKFLLNYLQEQKKKKKKLKPELKSRSNLWLESIKMLENSTKTRQNRINLLTESKSDSLEAKLG